jgi:hypothetical protein
LEGDLACPTFADKLCRKEDAMSRAELHFDSPRSVTRLIVSLICIGLASLAAVLWLARDRVLSDLLLASYYLMGLGLGGVLFVALQYVSGAGWSVAFRRVPEAMASVIPIAALCLMLVLVAASSLYPWTRSLAEETTPNQNWLHHFWFNWPFLLARSAIYLGSWLLLSRALIRRSRLQDVDGDVRHTYLNVRISALFLVVFSIEFWLASEDWLMSLDPDWSSTIFSVYHFSGILVAGVAGIVVMSAWLSWLGPFRHVLTKSHLHDLGMLLFGFSTFWMYLWFCQYMLIWYVDNPEETAWFTRRLHGAWLPLMLLNLLVNWGIPFVILLPRWTKEDVRILVPVAIVVLVGRWLDIYLGILGRLPPPPFPVALCETGLLAGVGGLFAFLFFRTLTRAPLLPLADPYLSESLPPSLPRINDEDTASQAALTSDH